MTPVSGLDLEILHLIGQGAAGGPAPELEPLALRIFAHQFERIPFYRAFCEAKKATPKTIRHFSEIPPFPTSGFKRARIASFPENATVATFFTSGTTQAERGVHEMDTLALYDTAASVSFRDFVRPPAGGFTFFSLIPPPLLAPRSSLAHMVGTLARKFSKTPAHYMEDPAGFPRELAGGETPVLIAATTVALADWLEYLRTARQKIALPPGSRLFETGGRKGRRSLPSTRELSESAAELIGIPPEHYLGEYGMTEISSPSWGELENGALVYRSPAWAPVRVVDPATGNEAAPGEEGMVAVFDSANRGSVSALFTGDWAKRRKDGFEILGRIVESELRGCSLITGAPPGRSGKNGARNGILAGEKKRVRAARAVPLERTLAALGELSARWLEPGFEKREQFEKSLAEAGLFSPGSVSAGLNRTFQAVAAARLNEAARKAWPSGRPDSGKRLAVHIYAGNLPVTGVFGFYASILSAIPSLHRPSARGGSLLPLLHETLKEIEPALAERAAIVETSSGDDEATKELLEGADAVIAQGDGETLEHLYGLAPAAAKFYPYRPRFSLAVLSSEPSDETLDRLSQDIFIWEQQGCLSPQVLFVENADPEQMGRCLLAAANRRAAGWGRKITPRGNGRIRWHAMEKETDPASHLTALIAEEIRPEWFSTPGLIQIVSVTSQKEMKQKLHAHAAFLCSVSTAGAPPGIPAERIAVFGELQSPPFDWPQDGHDRLLIYSR